MLGGRPTNRHACNKGAGLAAFGDRRKQTDCAGYVAYMNCIALYMKGLGKTTAGRGTAMTANVAVPAAPPNGFSVIRIKKAACIPCRKVDSRCLKKELTA